MGPGCRQAPRTLRDASARFGWLGEPTNSKGYFDIATGRTFMAGKRIVDAGDVDVSLDEGITRAQTTDHARKILETVRLSPRSVATTLSASLSSWHLRSRVR